MIKLKLSFGGKQSQELDIVENELLTDAVKRAFDGSPIAETVDLAETFNVTVNGMLIEEDFWEFTKLKSADNVFISPKIKDGEAGTYLKLAVLIVVSVYLTPVFADAFGAVGGALATAAVTIAASMALNALIPPPIPNLGDGFGPSSVEQSQMYSISGQSNAMRRLGTVPKVYGTHRIFPPLASAPYVELSVSSGDKARVTVGDITFMAVTPGFAGNSISITIQAGATAGSEIISVSGNAITITAQPGISTATQIFNALANSSSAKALITFYISGTAASTQGAATATHLNSGLDAGETIQYLYAIYDFGLGKMQISDIKIGDTPLTSESFRDFEFRFIDPNVPSSPVDDFDRYLSSEFQSYKNRRIATSLSLAFTDGTEFIEFSDTNTDADNMEIILDFVCPQGLYGLSSSGVYGDRSVQLAIDFALVGSSSWTPYNDLTYVDSFSSVGGTDVTTYIHNFAALSPDDPSYNTYYSDYEYFSSSDLVGNFPGTWGEGSAYSYVKRSQNKLLVPDDSRYAVGQKVFYGDRFLGIIQSISNISGANTELTLDRVITTRDDLPAFLQTANKDKLTQVVTYFAVYQYFQVKFSRHELSAAVITGSKNTPVYGNFRFSPKVAGQYKIRVKRITSFGVFTTAVGDALTWVGLSTAYKIAPINTTKRHVFLEVKIKATNQLNGHIQNLSAVVSSALNVYDPDTTTWSYQITNNPAWIVTDLLSGEVNKKSVSTSRLDLNSLVEWAIYCAEIPDAPPDHTYSRPRFECNFILDYQTTLQEVINQVAGSAQASLNIVDGKYGVLIDKAKDTPVQIFTPRNSKDFSSTRFYGNRPHGLKVKFIDPNLDWEVSEIIAYDNGYNVLNASEFEEVTAFACTDSDQAWRFGRYMIAANKLRQETMSLVVDFENLVCTRGDYVQITQDVMRVGGTPARVKDISATVVTIDDAIDIDPLLSYGYVFRASDGTIDTSTLTPLTARTFNLNGTLPAIGDLIVIGEVGSIVFDCIVKSIAPNDDMSATLTLVEKVDSIFDYESTDTVPDYDPEISQTSNPEFKPPNAVNDLAATENWRASDTKSGYEYYVDLSWSIPIGSVYEFFEIWVNDGRGYKKVDSTTDKIYRYAVDQTRLDLLHGFKVVAVAASGKKLQLIQMTEVTITPTSKSTAPSDVDSLDTSITNQVLQLSWPPIDDTDVSQYVLRFSTGDNDAWEQSIPLVVVNKDVTSASVQARTGVYMIKAIDYAGNQSANAARAVTTIPELFDLNVIDSINEAPTFPGVMTDIEVLGEAIVLSQSTPGDQDSVVFYDTGYYEFSDLLDLDDIYSVRLQSAIRADGYKVGELMSDWVALSDVDSLNSALHSDWDVSLQYRVTNSILVMSDWVTLSVIDHLNFGSGNGFTDWRDVPTTGDATGRVFAFRVKLSSLAANVTPRLFDATVNADMPDRQDSFDNQTSSAGAATVLTYDPTFKGPGTSPNVQVSIDNAATGDYWAFDYKTLEAVAIRFYDKNNIQVVRQFDLVAKGYGRRHTTSL